jgi:hypothetical protein
MRTTTRYPLSYETVGRWSSSALVLLGRSQEPPQADAFLLDLRAEEYPSPAEMADLSEMG